MVYKPSVVFHFVDYLFCFRPPNRLFFILKTISVVSSIRHSVNMIHGNENSLTKHDADHMTKMAVMPI